MSYSFQYARRRGLKATRLNPFSKRYTRRGTGWEGDGPYWELVIVKLLLEKCPEIEPLFRANILRRCPMHSYVTYAQRESSTWMQLGMAFGFSSSNEGCDFWYNLRERICIH